MCTIPPPPPPPQTTELTEKTSKPEKLEPELTFTYTPDIDICTWALAHPELQETCIRNKLCLKEPPFKYRYQSYTSILQEGPTCGIVALSMLVNGDLSPTEILNIAKEDGYTNNGEMFSCKNMHALAEKVFSMVKLENKLSLEYGQLFSDSLVERLLEGAVLLVPYDADFNHTPCLKNGHKAHWSLVCGVIIVNNPGIPYSTESGNVYVLCKHGKSKYLAAWKLEDLVMSNKNLWEFPPRRGETLSMYVLPEGGVGGDNGLRNQYVYVDRL